MERLQKVMAKAGIASRRSCEKMITDGRVQVNGQRATLGMKIDPVRDQVYLDNKPLSLIREKKRYILLNKPPGYVTTVKDPRGRPTVKDLIVAIPQRVYPVGRLDFASQGLLLLTNDGQLAMKLTHPSYGVEKTYIVQVDGLVSSSTIADLASGILLEDGPTAPAKVRILQRGRGRTTLEIGLREGRNRQIRRMCDKVGHPVIELFRVRLGHLHLGELPSGQWRELTFEEVKGLWNLVETSTMEIRTDKGNSERNKRVKGGTTIGTSG